MLTRKKDKKRTQIQLLSMDNMVPREHLLRRVDQAINFDFIYRLVEDKYSMDKGRPSIDPVMLIKIPLIQYMFGITSMRKTIAEIQVNVAYRWFLGLDMNDPVPHFSTFGKNYTRRFKGTDLFEQIFAKILDECFVCDLVDPTVLFVEATHVKARANKRKVIKQVVEKEVSFYSETLEKEIRKDREDHGKKPLKNNDDDPNSTGGTTPEPQTKTIKASRTDPDSGWFHKGDHQEVFAYGIQTACDANGWILGYSVHPGNRQDSRTFSTLYEKIKNPRLKKLVADAGYKIPAIAKMLIDDGILPVFPYKRPMTKKGFFKKYDYAYDEYYDCYLCPNHQILSYSTTNRDGYREYKSKGKICQACAYLTQCTLSKNHVKRVIRHVWEDYMEQCEDIRHTLGVKEIYARRKETIERIFGTAKEYHGMRYTQYIGKARMQMQVGLTFACLNLKKLAKMKQRMGLIGPFSLRLFWFLPFNPMI